MRRCGDDDAAVENRQAFREFLEKCCHAAAGSLANVVPRTCLDLRESGRMGWDALELWGPDVERVEPLTGGVANEVWSVPSSFKVICLYCLLVV